MCKEVMKSLSVEGFKAEIKQISTRNKILRNLPLSMTGRKRNDHPRSLPVQFYLFTRASSAKYSERDLSASDGTAQILDCSDSDCIDCLLPFSEETPIYKKPNYFASFILLISYYCLIQHKMYTIMQEKYIQNSCTFHLPEYVLINEQQARKLFSVDLCFFHLFPLSPLVE